MLQETVGEALHLGIGVPEVISFCSAQDFISSNSLDI